MGNTVRYRALRHDSPGIGIAVNKYDEYQRNAEVCLSMSRKARREDVQMAWLQLAQEWLLLLPSELAEGAQASFDAAAQDQGTGQEDSTASH
jgi:hypothetical protein